MRQCRCMLLCCCCAKLHGRELTSSMPLVYPLGRKTANITLRGKHHTVRLARRLIHHRWWYCGCR